MHLRVQMFQTDAFGQFCAFPSSCEHSECYQKVRFQHVSHFALLPSSETHFSMSKHDSRLIRKSLSLDPCRVKCAIGADPGTSPMCSKSLSLEARRWNCVSDMFKFIIVICSYLLSRDAHRSKCVFCMLKCALARHPSIKMLFLCTQRCSRSTTVDPNAFSIGTVYLG